ncbi:hypothetical protein G7K_6926-t1 [Saitoella complicata NRRL Y-17804]|uniref:Replication gene A protein-like domain-containing protein n=1 Tax=Saitoella complicata (strain BCRC 22490 / CBS 7301 / JCM 7358 / NBRC 10748 / NRRL Y-17804) TaxID=698492 RepID=A0A0E9NU03_SAICN|nr:hypothetical protein G7K_6926-t1 [Saitoella complicata NRRL Y-17804]
MPPNLGGFFMVRSYYPSECHADYFDFERIEALKPAIEACGISTLSQSPMLGFHKQMDNRIKLLEEILSFRMQGVEFDNGDMYVDGHKAASDVRDEFVSVTEKLMDELAQCYNVLPQLDINNTIDHRPEGDEKWFLENEKTVTQFCRKLAAERPLKDIRDEYNYPKKKGIKDECSRLLEASTMKSRRGFAIQRLMNAMRQAHADGWFIVFDTLTLADDRLEAFYDNPNALRDYFRDIGRMVLAAEGRKANDSHADCYQYFCVPEYGTANGRLHFHAVHFMRTLPTGSVDPNFGRRVRNRRQLNSLQNTWPYGYSMPIAVRYTQDAFSRSGWLWPVDAKGEPLKATSYMAVGFYVAKYVNKKSDMDLAAKGLGAKEWNNSLKTKLSLLPKKLFRIRMSRNFGMKMLTMTNLSTECLIQLTKLGYDATPFNQILKQNAKREMRLRLGKVTVADVLAAQPVTTNLLKFMRASIKMIGVSNLQSFIASMTQKLTLSDISDESKNYLDKAGITTACLRIKSNSRSSYFATFRHQLTILSKTDALDEEKWLNMLGTFVKDWFRYESHFVHGRDSLVDILKERGLLSDQVTEQSVRFQTALASIKLIQASAVLDLTEDDFDFLTSNKVWIATDRSRARRCVEACVYGTLDFVGYPRFPAPVEFIAAVIAYYVHPVNIQTACLIMEGAEFTENIINGVERPVKAAELFAFTLRVRAGNTDVLTDAEENVRKKRSGARPGRPQPLRGTKGKRKGARLWYVGGQQF